jgi:acyl-CoA reductase-like NAD-dependent aldehyde dehydrogenase
LTFYFKRIFVEALIYNRFAELLVEMARRLKVGNQLEEDTDVGRHGMPAED